MYYRLNNEGGFLKMAFALSKKKIRCPNCGYEGDSEIKGAGVAGWMIFVAIAILGLFFWPLLLIAGILFFVLLFMPAKHICPTCKWQNPIPMQK